MSTQAPTVPRWLNVVVAVCLVVTAAAVVAAVVAPLANGFDQRHATIITAIVTGGASLGLGAFALRFQIKSQTNGAKLELYKQQLAISQEMCRRCFRLNIDLSALANNTTHQEVGLLLDRFADGFLEVVRDHYSAFLFIMPDPAGAALTTYLSKVDETFGAISKSVPTAKEIHATHTKQIDELFETLAAACRTGLHLDALRRGMMTQLHRHSG